MVEFEAVAAGWMSKSMGEVRIFNISRQAVKTGSLPAFDGLAMRRSSDCNVGRVKLSLRDCYNRQRYRNEENRSD
jgi:hypothetical protein